jgi:predicted alpha/beta superfamily hydrolase
MSANSQPDTAASPDKSTTLTLHSNLLNEDRTVHVYLPAGYKQSERYDVVYVIDGEMLVRFFPAVRAFDEENDLVPPLIIVGIDNLYWYDKGLDSRDRDLLPARVPGSPLSGGADRFLSFLQSELVPFINRTYSTTGHATLFGHSYGGMFTLYAFLSRPQIFDHYIASDPALWWNDGYVLKMAGTHLKTSAGRRQTLFIGGRSGRINEAFGIKQMVSILKANAPASLHWKNATYADEDHGSVRLKDIYDGLKFTYFGHSGSMIDVFPQNGILLKNKPVALMNYATYLDENPGIRYTLNGSDPTAKSPRYEYGIKVSAPAHFRIKQFSNWGPDKSATGTFKLGKSFPPSPLPPHTTPGGLHYDLYAGRDFTGPIKASGREGGNFDVKAIGGKGPFALRLSGYFEAKTDGYYTFLIETDASAKWSVDGKQLIDLLPVGSITGATSFVVPLSKGFHSVRLDYAHTMGDPSLNLTYLPPAATGALLARLPIPLPNSLLRSPGE